MAHGESSAVSLFPTLRQNSPRFWVTSLWLTNSSSCTARPTTSTCGWGPYLSPLCQEVGSGRSCPACWPNSSGHWEMGTGKTKSLCKMTSMMILDRKSNSVFVSRGFGGRGKACSPARRGGTSTPSPCPASFVTTATSLTSLLTRSHAPRGRRTWWPVLTPSSLPSISPHGKNQTLVRKWEGRLCDFIFVCWFCCVTLLHFSARPQLWSDTQNSVRLLAALQLCDSVSVSLWLQAAGFIICQLWSKQPAVELRPPSMSRYEASAGACSQDWNR